MTAESLPPIVKSLAKTEALAATVADLARRGDVILLDGPLGAGKSAFARAFIRHAAGDPALEVPSPTFTLVQTYDTPRFPIHHYDLWRVDGPEALAELGWADTADGVALVEWPDRLGRLRPEGALTVALSPVPDEEDARRIVLSGWPGRLGRAA
jgi:tRNA threonylcarbamoyladenosine biosynthesis protein TsaE